MRQLGVEWVILMSHYGSHWPVRVRGLDGTTLNAIANNAEVSNLSQLCEQASDGSFLLIGSDFETPTDLGVLEKRFRRLMIHRM